MDLKAAKTELDTRYKMREKWMPLSREIVADCAQAIRDVHVYKDKAARAKSKVIAKKVAELAAVAKKDSRLSGMTATPYQEWVELEVLLAFIENKPLPTLAAPADHYLLGVLDALGEGKRVALDLLMQGKFDDASRFYDKLEETYYSIEGYSFPNSLVSGFKAKQDAMKRTLEGLHQIIVQASVIRSVVRGEEDA